MKKIFSMLLFFLLTITVCYMAIDDSNLIKFTIESRVLSAQLISQKVVRLHVIANSDSEVDQDVKLQVKDAVLREMTPKLNASTSKEETIQIINDNKQNIQHIAQDTLAQCNMNNSVNIQLDKTFFPTKFYNQFSLPAGEYLALRVVIGEGEGKNWWCVLFPPLCLVDVKKETSDTQSADHNNPLEKNLDRSENQIGDENTSIVLDEDKKDKEKDQNKFKIRWKTLEYFGFYSSK
ncbi:MAG: stage II sporulation protein R [Eubacteriales bacterium]